MQRDSLSQWRVNFFTGLAVLLPVIITIALVVWLFGTVSSVTDTLLFFLPRRWTHQNAGVGPVYWYWSVVALLLAVLLVGMVGRLTRNYIGRKAISLLDDLLLRIPLVKNIYGTVKQVNDAFSSNNKSSFRQVVLVEFPKAGMQSIGFITGETNPGMVPHAKEPLLSVFVPTTPNPTTGFLILVPEHQVTKLSISIAEGIKFIISLGAVSPEISNPASPSGKAHPGPT
jgi:uncharacterized membrane protein